MNRFLVFVLIVALGAFTIGCGKKTGTTENKTQRTTTQTKDGEITGQRKITTTETTKTTPPVVSDADGQTTEKTTETTTETTK